MHTQPVNLSGLQVKKAGLHPALSTSGFTRAIHGPGRTGRICTYDAYIDTWRSEGNLHSAVLTTRLAGLS